VTGAVRRLRRTKGGRADAVPKAHASRWDRRLTTAAFTGLLMTSSTTALGVNSAQRSPNQISQNAIRNWRMHRHESATWAPLGASLRTLEVEADWDHHAILIARRVESVSTRQPGRLVDASFARKRPCRLPAAAGVQGARRRFTVVSGPRAGSRATAARRMDGSSRHGLDAEARSSKSGAAGLICGWAFGKPGSGFWRACVLVMSVCSTKS
jgi:hypothetical protein